MDFLHTTVDTSCKKRALGPWPSNARTVPAKKNDRSRVFRLAGVGERLNLERSNALPF